LDAARKEADTLNAQIATHDEHLKATQDEIAAKAAELEDWGQSLMQSLHDAEQAIEISPALPDTALVERVEQAASLPICLTTVAIQRSTAQQTSARKHARDARDVQTSLSEKHADYLKLLPGWREANRYANLYTTLTAKLGREGIQSWLRKEAERRIVEYADLTLQRLTGGMLSVRLSANSTETLDLRVTDHEKNARDLKPDALSGSQKFRLSVALALGIGQYACGKSEGGIQSVIIDEGFGSLDKEGRDQMTAELENLGRILKRIIVVSHQEDMETAFENRWRIYTEGKTSKAELVA
jgi:DNA repair exonuclease SbcCD ATPase subunit